MFAMFIAPVKSIGINVQGFDGGGSESFVSDVGILAPAPGALVLGAMGVALVG